jgi:hypothetical protein
MNPHLKEIMQTADAGSADPANGLTVLEALFRMSPQAQRLMADLLYANAAGVVVAWDRNWSDYLDEL